MFAHTKEQNARNILVGFHRMHGYGGGWLYNIWLVFYDLASLSLILFAVSGTYLWWRLARRRWLVGLAGCELGLCYHHGGVPYLRTLTHPPVECYASFSHVMVLNSLDMFPPQDLG